MDCVIYAAIVSFMPTAIFSFLIFGERLGHRWGIIGWVAAILVLDSLFERVPSTLWQHLSSEPEKVGLEILGDFVSPTFSCAPDFFGAFIAGLASGGLLGNATKAET